MKTLLLIGLCLAGFSAPCFSQTLSLINPLTDTSTVSVLPGGTFTLEFEILGPVTTNELDSFSTTLSGSTSSITPLPTGITILGYSNLVNGFEGGEGSSKPYIFSAAANDISDDIAFSPTVPVTLVAATFSISSSMANGSYAINFAPEGGLFQGLFDSDSPPNPISYTAFGATIDVVPEPTVTGLLAMGLAFVVGLRFVKRPCRG